MGSCGLERAARAGPIQIPVQAQSNPAGCPDWARTRQAGLAHSNPARAPAGLAIWEPSNPNPCFDFLQCTEKLLLPLWIRIEEAETFLVCVIPKEGSVTTTKT